MKRLETTIDTSQAYIYPILIEGLSLKIRRYKSKFPPVLMEGLSVNQDTNTNLIPPSIDGGSVCVPAHPPASLGGVPVQVLRGLRRRLPSLQVQVGSVLNIKHKQGREDHHPTKISGFKLFLTI